METIQIQLLFFIIQALLLYLITRSTLRGLFIYLSSFTRNKKVVYALISTIYFPGTLLHETAHLAMATILLLRIKEIQIFPKITAENTIKLGHVLYEKRGAIRGVLVGAAPFFVGIAFFWSLTYFNLFPNPNLWLTILFGYLIFAVSSTMFSSRQDLVDILYAIPLVIMGIGIVYIFDLTAGFEGLIRIINLYLFFPLVINFFIWIITIWLKR